MARQLAANDQVAQAIILLHGKDPASALTFMKAATDAMRGVLDNDPDADADSVNEAAQSAIQQLGYVTDLDSLSRQYAYLKAHHAGFWSGSYTLVDSERQVHTLLISDKSVRLLLNGTDEALNIASEGGGFTAGALSVDNDLVHAVLTIATNVNESQLRSAQTDLAALAAGFRVIVSGTLTLKADGKVRNVKGTRGVATPVAVLNDLPEDPAWIWVGEYELRYTDTDDWEYMPDALVIDGHAGSDTLGVRLGGVTATKVAYTQHVIRCLMELTAGVSSQITLEMHTTSGGTRKCYAWIETTGQVRTLTGHASSRLDPSALWGESADSPLPANPRKPAQLSEVSAPSIVNFCSTTYDAVFSAADLLATDASGKTPNALLVGETIELEGGGQADGFRVDETDQSGNFTGRLALFTTPVTVPTSAAVLTFLGSAKLKAYQQLDEAGRPQAGLAFCRIGVLVDRPFELPSLVETDFYEVRLSLSEYQQINQDGLTITLAIDDASLPHLISLAQPDATRGLDNDGKCPCGDFSGPDQTTMDAVGNYTKASVLVRGASGETQVVGFKTYYLAVSRKGLAGVFDCVRTLYKPSNTGSGKYVRDGSPTTVSAPILMCAQLLMDSREALELTDTSWAPAYRGKKYRASVGASKGHPPYTWRVLHSDLPDGLSWEETAAGTAYGVNGTIGSGEDPGHTYQPSISVISDKSVVMKPVLSNPQITIAEPELERRASLDVAGVVLGALGSLGSLAAIGMDAFLFKKQSSLEEKKYGEELTKQVYALVDEKMRILRRPQVLESGEYELAERREYDRAHLDELTKKLSELSEHWNKLQSEVASLKDQLNNTQDQEEREQLIQEILGLEEKKKSISEEGSKTEGEEDASKDEGKAEGK